MTLIEWTTNPSSTNVTTTIPNDGLLRGIGSKQITLNYTGSGCALNVTPNVRFTQDRRQDPFITTQKPWHKTAVIENLIIDGTGSSNAVGILLEDVYNCNIRNVTIKNFAVGIKLTATNLLNVITEQGISTTEQLPDLLEFQNFSEANRIVHVRLENVGTGILFDSGTGSGSFACTTIDDVDILLQNSSSAVGIQVGTNTRLALPYSSRIKANIRQQSAGGTGIKLLNGELKYGLINIAVQGPTNDNAYGVDISGNANNCISGNQFSHFFLTCGGIPSTHGIWPQPPNQPANDILLKSY